MGGGVGGGVRREWGRKTLHILSFIFGENSIKNSLL